MENENLEEGRGKRGQARQAGRYQDDEWGKPDRIKKSFKNFRDNARRMKQAQYEEIEQIDELSKKTLGNYIKRASDELHDRAAEQGRHGARQKWDSYENAERQASNKRRGIKRATDRLTKEGLEEIEQIDELSKKTLQSYITKAGKSQERLLKKMDSEENKAMSTDGEKYPEKQARHIDNAKAAHGKFAKRVKSKRLALRKMGESVDMLTPEGLEAIEIGINEYFLTLGEEVDQETFDAMVEDVAAELVADLTEAEEANSVLEFNNRDNKKSKYDIIESVVDKYAPEIEYEELTEEEHIIDVLSKFVGNKAIQEVLDLYDNLDEENKDELLDLLDSKEGINEVLNFVIENRTEDE